APDQGRELLYRGDHARLRSSLNGAVRSDPERFDSARATRGEDVDQRRAEAPQTGSGPDGNPTAPGPQGDSAALSRYRHASGARPRCGCRWLMSPFAPRKDPFAQRKATLEDVLSRSERRH